jgi:hypothetical protein
LLWRKHGTHDQKTHGNWAEGSSESGLDAMPYEWKPKLNKSGMTDEEYAKNAEILKKLLRLQFPHISMEWN